LEDARRKVDAILDRRHVTAVNPIPLKHGIPLIEAMAVEDDPGIQKMWAGLMANSLDPSTRFKMRKLFITLLSEFEPLDAVALKEISGIDLEGSVEVRAGWNVGTLAKHLGVDIEEMKLSLINLYRLGCVVDARPMTWENSGISQSGLRVNQTDVDLFITPLGRSLVEHCRA
jgi:hypothetical protein